MTKKEMITKMTDICFKVQGVSLQLQAGQLLNAAAATTEGERDKCIDAVRLTIVSVEPLNTAAEIIKSVHPEGLDMDELPPPFNELEKMTEEEIAEWIMAQIKLAKEGMTE